MVTGTARKRSPYGALGVASTTLLATAAAARMRAGPSGWVTITGVGGRVRSGLAHGASELEEQPCVAPREIDELHAQMHARCRRLLVEPELHRTSLRLAARRARARQIEEDAHVQGVRLAGRSRRRLRDDRRARARDQRQGERNDVEQPARGPACYARVPSGMGGSCA